jgi:basic membrane protein A
LQAGIVKISPYGPAVGEVARQQTEAVRAQFMAGTFVIFKGSLQSNTGTTLLPSGEEYVQTDLRLEKMDWLVEGVLGSIS